MTDQSRKLNSVPSTVPITQTRDRTAAAYSVHVSEILKQETEQTRFLIPGCLPRGNIVLLTGEPSARKSWVAYDLAHAIATGGLWMGRGSPCPDGIQPVVILNYDNPTETLRDRLKNLGFTSSDNCYVHTLGFTKPYHPNMPDLLKMPDEKTRLQYMLEVRRPALVIYDSVRQGITIDENDSQKVAELMGLFKAWTAVNDTTVVLIHHTAKGKPGNSGWTAEARGSGEFIASADLVIKARRKEDSNTSGELEWEKCRTWEIGKTKLIDFEVVDEFKDGAAPTTIEGDDLQEIDLVQRVLVRARSPFPFEIELARVDRVVEELQKSRSSYVSYGSLKKLCESKGVIRNEADLKEAFVQDAKGRGYALKG
jgi:AAA domain